MKQSLYCDDCKVEIFVDVNMVMLKDELWKSVNGGKMEGTLCADCIEKKLGRNITSSDFKAPSTPFFAVIPCNAMWMQEKYNNGDTRE